MGAKTWMVVYADGRVSDILKSQPASDPAAARALAERLFPGEPLAAIEDGYLSDTSPRGNEICVGCFPRLKIVASETFALDHPSQLDPRIVAAGGGGTVHLHAMHSVVDWFAFAIWENGRLVRALSVAPDGGVREDIGPRLPFELPYWNGQHAVEGGDEPYPLPFHPLELGEAALREFFGYNLEGPVHDADIPVEEIVLQRFKRAKRWWKFW